MHKWVFHQIFEHILTCEVFCEFSELVSLTGNKENIYKNCLFNVIQFFIDNKFSSTLNQGSNYNWPWFTSSCKSVLHLWCSLYTFLYIKLSVPPIWIYIPSDAQLSPQSFGIFKSVCWYGNCFYFSFVFAICSSKRRRYVARDLFTEKGLSR